VILFAVVDVPPITEVETELGVATNGSRQSGGLVTPLKVAEMVPRCPC